MRSIQLSLVLVTAVVVVAYLVFSPGPARPKPVEVSAAIDPTDDLVIGKPFVFQNLAVFPVSSKAPRQSDRFITLDEGLRAGTVEIFERGARAGGSRTASDDPFGAPGAPPANVAPDPFSPPAPTPAAPPQPTQPAADPLASPSQQQAPAATANSDTPTQAEQQSARQEPGVGNAVNELMVVNRSDRPLYLMPGEIIIGGDQDRTIAEELVIAPGDKPIAIDVFCVEHGRWGDRNEAEYARIVEQVAADGHTNALAVADRGSASDSQNLSLVVSATQIAEQANSGKFVGSVGALNKPVRLAVQSGEGQGKVWDEVANQNAKADVRAATGTFAGNYSETEASERLAPFLKQLQAPISDTPNVVGVIVAVNGEIESMDVFESTPLFKKLWPKLLKSYALDASSAEQPTGEAKQATADEAIRFLRNVASAQRKSEDTKGDLALLRSESDDVLAFTVHERKGSAAGQPAAMMGGFGGMGGGFFGGAVHSSGYSK